MLNEIEAWNSGLVLMQLQVNLSVRGVYQEFNPCPIKTLKLMNRKQNVEIAFGFKSYTAVSTLPFALSISSLIFSCFSCPVFVFFCCKLISPGKSFWESF